MDTTKQNVAVVEPVIGVGTDAQEKEAALDKAIRRMRDHDRTSLEIALDVGGRLLDLKEETKHGDWGEWLRKKAETHGVHERTLQNFMELANLHKDGKLKDVTGLQAAYERRDELNRQSKDNKEEKSPANDLVAKRMSVEDIHERIKDLAGKRSTVQTVEITVANVKELRALLSQTAKQKGDAILDCGGVVVIKRTADGKQGSGKKAAQKEKRTRPTEGKEKDHR